MGRPPCCDKIGVMKGPWAPEEDTILVSYIQEHGPGNWRAVPTNTGLLRCSKSCRLRWTNYLRPGIKRGNFTPNEEKMIIHLQALLGNRWAAIASYLPQRTDNDIKNYWNTHLKKLKKLQAGQEGQSRDGLSSTGSQQISRGQWERRLQTDIHMARQALSEALSPEKPNSLLTELKPSCGYEKPAPASLYASSTENIAKLLKGWMRSGPNQSLAISTTTQNSFNNMAVADSFSSEETLNRADENGTELSEAFESLFGFDSSNIESEAFESLFGFDSSNIDFSQSTSPDTGLLQDESKPNSSAQVPLSLIERWLFDEGAMQGKEYLSEVTPDENNLF